MIIYRKHVNVELHADANVVDDVNGAPGGGTPWSAELFEFGTVPISLSSTKGHGARCARHGREVSMIIYRKHVDVELHADANSMRFAAQRYVGIAAARPTMAGPERTYSGAIPIGPALTDAEVVA